MQKVEGIWINAIESRGVVEAAALGALLFRTMPRSRLWGVDHPRRGRVGGRAGGLKGGQCGRVELGHRFLGEVAPFGDLLSPTRGEPGAVPSPDLMTRLTTTRLACCMGGTPQPRCRERGGARSYLLAL